MVRESLTIVTESPKNAFYPGQTLSGLFNVELDETIKATEIQIRLRGKGFCFWTEGGGEHTRYYFAKETYCSETQVVYGKEQSHADSFELTPGHHSYRFSIKVPEKIPTSFEFNHNRVRYTLKATIVRPWIRNKSTKILVSIVSPYDLNQVEGRDLMGTGENTGTKTICCFCCESQPISATVRTDRKGYVPGDTIVFNAEINNMSGRSIKRSKGQLTMIVTLIAGGKRRDFINKLDKIKHGPVEPGGSDVYRNERLTIPPVPPSYLLGCKIIAIKYYVSIIAFPAGPSLNLRVHSEVVIGTVPLSGIASQYGLTLPTSLGTPAGPLELYSDAALSSIPQSSLEEGVFGKNDEEKKKKKKKKAVNPTSSSDFVPVYTYYKWNQQSPADLFTVSH